MNNLAGDEYGLHLMLRISEIEKPQTGNDPELLKNFLITLVEALQMRVLAGPCIGFESGDQAHCGYSGVVILYESHIAIHNYPFMRQAFIDIFSCKIFDPQAVYDQLTQEFGHYNIIEEKLLSRGTHWQNDAQSALGEWMDQK